MYEHNSFKLCVVLSLVSVTDCLARFHYPKAHCVLLCVERNFVIDLSVFGAWCFCPKSYLNQNMNCQCFSVSESPCI